MGDTPTGQQPLGHGARPDSAGPSSPSPFDEGDGRKGFQGGLQMHGSQGNYPNLQSFSAQQHSSQARQEHFNMASLGTALSDMSYMNYSNVSPQGYPSGPSSSPHVYQMQNIPQLGGPPPMSPPATNLPYNVQYQAQYPGMYAPNHSQSTTSSQSGLDAGNQFYQGQTFMGQHPVSPYFIQQGQYAPQAQIYSGSPSSGQYGSRGAFIGESRPLPQQRVGEYQGGSSSAVVQGKSSSVGK